MINIKKSGRKTELYKQLMPIYKVEDPSGNQYPEEGAKLQGTLTIYLKGVFLLNR